VQRFYLPPDETRDELLTLSDREAHHALNVVRLRPGEAVMVLNGEGERLRCETIECARRAVRLRVVSREKIPGPTWPVTLIQAMPKGKAFDTIVQKATELGTQRIVPLVTQRVIAQIEPHKHESKLDHWRAIALESIKQCGSPWMPEICAPLSLDACLKSLPPASLRLVASLRYNALLPSELLDAPPHGAHGAHGAHGVPALAGETPPSANDATSSDAVTPSRLTLGERIASSPARVATEAGPIQLWIGPEGDFTEEELNAIEAAGARPMTFGPLVLRADTAAIYGLSVIGCAIQRWSR